MGILQEENKRLEGKIYEYDEGKEYMSDMGNWVIVHLTKYEPKSNPKGELYIETTAMATGYEQPRATVHVAINQVVGNILGGNWDAAPVVVLAPYNDVVEKNGNPQEVAVEDTYFIPNPDTGLVLPNSAYIVKPDPNSDKLFELGEHGATYKTDNYTKEEIEDILSLDPWNRDTYDKYASGNVSESEAKTALGNNEKLVKFYQNAKDKKAFMRGIFEEKRFELLNKMLRDFVVKMSLEKMGYHYVYAHEDDVSGKVAEVAREAGMRGNSGNKGHSFSLEHELEEHGVALVSWVNILKRKDYNQIYECMTKFPGPINNSIMDNILFDKEIPDFYKSFENVFDDSVARRKKWYEIDKQSGALDETREKLWQIELRNLENGLHGYNPFLDKMIHRHSKRMRLECVQALKDLKQNPEDYAQFKKRLMGFKSGGEPDMDEILRANRYGR